MPLFYRNLYLFLKFHFYRRFGLFVITLSRDLIYWNFFILNMNFVFWLLPNWFLRFFLAANTSTTLGLLHLRCYLFLLIRFTRTYIFACTLWALFALISSRLFWFLRFSIFIFWFTFFIFKSGRWNIFCWLRFSHWLFILAFLFLAASNFFWNCFFLWWFWLIFSYFWALWLLKFLLFSIIFPFFTLLNFRLWIRFLHSWRLRGLISFTSWFHWSLTHHWFRLPHLCRC